MEMIAALTLVFGIACRVVKPKGICTNCLWILSAFISVTIAMVAEHNWEYLWQILRVSVAIFLLLLIFGLVGFLRELSQWCDE